MGLINIEDAESTYYSLQEDQILQTPRQTPRNVNQHNWSQTRADLAWLTQIPVSASACQGLDHLLNLMSPLLGGETQPTIHEDDSNNESILSNITDAKLEESGLKF